MTTMAPDRRAGGRAGGAAARPFRSFDAIYADAVAHKGDGAAVEGRLPKISTPEELAAIPDDRWLAGMTKAIFQAGFSWQVIDRKWPDMEVAFEGFDPARWALMSDQDLDRLLADRRVVRNATKLRSVGANAVFLRALAVERGTAAAVFADWPGEDFIGLLALLKQRGSRLGGSTAQYFLRQMGRDGFVLSNDVTKALIRDGIVDKAPSSKRDLEAVQAAFNAWHAESGRPLAHISRVLALSVGP